LSKKKIDSVTPKRPIKESFDGLTAIKPKPKPPKDNQGGAGGGKPSGSSSKKK
jgi:hypothetical protein